MSHELDFVHLHLHTEYSLLDGFARIDKVVNYAKSLNMHSLAITDHGTMFGVIDFYRTCKDAGIKPIIGVEAYLARRTRFDRDSKLDARPYHMLLLAENQQGYQNLLHLSSEAQLNGYYYRPRIDWDLMAAHAEGIIATSGCLAAEIPRLLDEGREADALQLIGKYQDVFGKDNFFLELQAHDIPELDRLNRWLIDNADYARAPLIATNDVHYVRLEDFDIHDTLLCIQTGSLKDEQNRMSMTDNSYHLRTQAEMWNLFGEVPTALENTVLVAERCQLNLDKKEYHLPVFPVPERFADAGVYLRYLCERGLEWRYGERASDPAVYERLDYELAIIHEMGFDTYFLIVWDLCEFARYADIWWNVRGSGAGSIVAYTLGVTSLDPLENALLFERFLNPGRVSMPDFDLDFPEDRRMEMIEYCTRKYGQDKVAAIITFGTLGAKAAIRDVGRALGVELTEVNKIAAAIPTQPKLPKIPELLGDDPEKALPDLKEIYKSNATAKKIIDIAAGIEGVPRHASTHAAGIIVSDRPLVEYLPLHRPTKGDAEDSPVKMVTQFPMETAESIGLLKIDFLGLSTLTILRKACELIEEYHGIRYDMSSIPIKPDPDNPELSRMVEETFRMIGEGHTLGVFQIESPGMRQMLTGMRPTTFEHIIAAISLYRPGPMDYIPTYNARMHGTEPVHYHHEKLIPILQNTYGILVYQEQIMQVASELFGYKLGEADLMRRAVSKKKEKDLLEHRAIFIERGPQYGVSEKAAIAIFDDIAFFARYGFNKCLVGSTEIVDAATGRLVTLDALASGEAQVTATLSLETESQRFQPRAIQGLMANGVRPVFRLQTASGREIEATDNHPFYTPQGWRTLGELALGDLLALPARLPIEGQQQRPYAELAALADQLSEQAMDSLPPEVFELRRESLQHFIDCLLETALGLGEGGLTILYRTPHHRLARQLQHLLLRLDTHCALREVQQPSSGQPLYELLLAQGEVTGDLFWDTVRAISPQGEAPTYDLTIEGTHNFLANDLVVHNSHAADYAVITCQTAFLKCHYPHEYMAALMSVYYDDAPRVSLFVADCRRMSIRVLPPDVNASQKDFSIEAWEDGRHIRYGLSSIKNLGLGAIEYMLQCRGDEAFADLDDFLKRVDMRHFGKRGLEALVKAGALDAFADRAFLLANLDRMMGFSNEYHKSASVGQVSMFDLMQSTSVDDAGSVFNAMTEPVPPGWDQREQLRWEKELLGLYVSDHPLNAHWGTLERGITHTIAELVEQREHLQRQNVRLAGLVNDLRSITTRKGDPMAVLTLEDITGTIECVMFPRTWAQYRELVEVDKVVCVAGVAEQRGNDVQVIVDNMTQNLSLSSAEDDALASLNGTVLDFREADEALSESAQDGPPWEVAAESPAAQESSRSYGHAAEPEYESAPAPVPAERHATPASSPEQGGPSASSPEEPEDFRAWMNQAPAEEPPYSPDDDAPPADMPPPMSAPIRKKQAAQEPAPLFDTRTGRLKPPNGRAAVPRSAPAPTRMLTVYMERSGEAERDKRRLHIIYNAMNEFPGTDHFCIILEKRDGKRVRLDFPKVTTCIQDELLDKLAQHDWILDAEIH